MQVITVDELAAGVVNRQNSIGVTVERQTEISTDADYAPAPAARHGWVEPTGRR